MSREKSAYIGCFYSLLAVIILLVALFVFGACRSVKYVPVVEKHTEYVSHTDSIIQKDTLEIREQTIIREVDSATMAQYGIELKNMQKAWLIQTDRLQKRISELMKANNDSTAKCDSIPQPYPVEVEVPAQLSWWQKVRMHIGEIALVALLVLLGSWIVRIKW